MTLALTLPAWLAPLPDAEQMRATDAWAIAERGIPGPELMERAGAGLARVIAERAPQGTIVIVCGAGNNGGDGYVAARLLRREGRDVRVLTVADPGKLKGDAKRSLDRLPGSGPAPWDPAALADAAVVVDAMLGTGSSGAPRAEVADAIAAINALRSGAAVIAVDVPSGVDASTGEIAAEAIRAGTTATFHAAKPGLWINPGKEHAGEVVTIDIGIPEGGPAVPLTGLIGDGVLGAYPRRRGDSTKFASGHVLVAGGSRGLTGAPCLAALAAARAGAGYVTACVPASLETIFEIKLTEVMSTGLPDEAGAFAAEAAEAVVERAESRGGALVLGPGLGRADGTFTFAREVARRAGAALVLDADGLNAHAGELLETSLARRAAPTVLTPHAGELARLLETSSAEVAAHRLAHVREAARRSRAIVVLKGDDTLVAEPEGRVAVSPGGSPGLATAGTGDVLSGVLGAFLARGMEPFAAACAAVAVHAEAGRRAALALSGPDGVIASDVVGELPHALAG